MRDQRRGGILILIGLFRLTKALLLIAGGLATLRLLRPETAPAVWQWVRSLPITPGHDLLIRTAARLVRLEPKRIEELAIGAFAYAALFIVEGTGLLMRRVWAEYLTIVATTSFIPFEIYELVKRMTPIRVGLLLINIAIVIYLVWRRVESRTHEGNSRFLHGRS